MKTWGKRLWVAGLLLLVGGVVAIGLEREFIGVIFMVPSIPLLVIGGFMGTFDSVRRAWKFLADKRWT